MGQELECRARFHGRSMEGRAQLETDFILFQGPERIKVGFCELTGVKAQGGVLRLEFAGGPAELELGAATEKWARKILNPRSRMEKLGVKAGLAVRLVGEFPPDFGNEIKERQAVAVTNGTCDLLFVAATKSADLAQIRKRKAELKPGGALWVVYPKSVPEIREVEVIQMGRAAGMKDVKVVRFSPTHTGLKFMATAPVP